MIGVIQGTFGVIQGTFGVIQGTFGVIQMMIISPSRQLGLRALSSGVLDVFTSISYVFTQLPRHSGAWTSSL
jgi:hypothetical protein